jgi:ribose 5-phosphate isomerase A
VINQKKIVAKAALEFIEEGMVVGCGSGSTSMEFLRLLVKLDFADSLTCVPTSEVVRDFLKRKKMKVVEVEDVKRINIGVDGADNLELDTGVCIKGGGGAHVLEKKVSEKCDDYLVIIDSSKLVDHFDGLFVPVEVEAERLGEIVKSFEKKDLNFGVRDKFSDSGNMLVDVEFKPELLDMNLYEFDEALKDTDGVVGTGIFMDQVDRCLVAYEDGEVKEFEF